MLNLPYPGHSWSFTQHAVGLHPKALYDLLQCAAPFEGEVENYSSKITNLMVETGVLTPNERDGQADAWRDYQQILAELGLIYSTRICKALTLTSLGRMYLAGEVGFSELIGLQAFRYQYPNGQKTTIQSRLRAELESASIPAPRTLVELQADNGVLIKPAILILRILIELQKTSNYDAVISVGECQSFLIPCRMNSEWKEALAQIISSRQMGENLNDFNRHSRRNIQEWFKLLNKTDFLKSNGSSYVRLSDYAVSVINDLENYCSYQEDLKTFWIPTSFDTSAWMNWFSKYGSVNFNDQLLIQLSNEMDENYVAENYVAGLEGPDVSDDFVYRSNTAINLRAIDLDRLNRKEAFFSEYDLAAFAQKMRDGMEKRHAKTILHDRIVKELAEKFISQGAKVEDDPDSVDLMATWPEGYSAMFEIKTVTRRSLPGRLRTAVGQIQEYSYRRQMDGEKPSDKIIVFNIDLDESMWQTSFLKDHLGIGLICRPENSYRAYVPQSALSGRYWLSK